MSTAARRIPLDVAQHLVRGLIATLGPSCERIEVAGSVRRRSPDVGDLELVAIPKVSTRPGLDLFRAPEQYSPLDDALLALHRQRRVVPHPERPAAGERYRRLWLPDPGIQLDLFLVLPPAEWGPIFTIRTGPAEYSRELVARLWRYGLRCVDGQITRFGTGEVLPCREERDFFQRARLEWVAPEERR